MGGNDMVMPMMPVVVAYGLTPDITEISACFAPL
jgi:hypothetical protein